MLKTSYHSIINRACPNEVGLHRGRSLLSRRIVAVLFCLLSVSLAIPGLQALPPMLPVAARFAEADVVILASIQDTQRRKFNDISENVSLRVKVEKVYKNEGEANHSIAVPADFHMAFLVFPETFEKHLRRPVGDGRYFLFLNRKEVIDANGEKGEVLVLSEPRPFAFLPYTEFALREVENLAAASGENE